MRRLLAYLPVGDPRLPAFQQAGFHIYAHEDLFRLADSTSRSMTQAMRGLRSRRAEDAWGLARLHHGVTPPVVQQAEGLSRAGQDAAICAPVLASGARGYVLEEDQEIVGYSEVRCGHRGAWVHFLLHPGADDMARSLIRGTLCALPRDRVYCGLRDYQGGIGVALQGLGFEPFGRQALLVRYIAVFARRPVVALAPTLEKGAEVIAPVAQASEDRR